MKAFVYCRELNSVYARYDASYSYCAQKCRGSR